ncbi:unnamed protein product [Microthlaspi erraticum]|uniref:Retrotransposon gag domain-containing protein n=1 Tax=Microthlaspi erraticum TaxID=1685480 RepID=A0A6D2IW25_9BRAS|nr:unnamed protein product [Microthlaspi erraticum]
MTRRSNKDNLVEHPEIDKLEKQLRKQKAQEMADEAARAHAAEVARAQEEGRDPPPPPPNPAGDVNAQPQAGAPTWDKASRWLKSLPAHSITTWDEYKAAFINHFYTKQRSISVRNKICTFRQANNESFYEALDRFKEYIRDCPNHGFNEGNLWNIFYRGIDHKYKLSWTLQAMETS